MREHLNCSSCRYFNRWVMALFGEADEDAPICRKHMWEYSVDMTETLLAEALNKAADCEHYIKRTGGTNV